MPRYRRSEGYQPKSVTKITPWAMALTFAVTASISAQAAVIDAADRFSSIVIDAGTGQVLSATQPNVERYPASLTKMMTLYLAFEALRDHRISPDQFVPVSEHAASQEPSKLGLVPGSKITVHQAMLGLVTKSANDAACALGELIGGSEQQFAAMMTMRAHAIGMSHTVFRNASGLPDPDQVTTASDLALLARHLIRDFPDQYRLFSTPSFFWHGQLIANHDHLLKSYPGADGIKTGYTDAAGHNLVTSAVRDNVRLIGVVLGATSNPERDARMAAQLNSGYAELNVALPAAPAVQLALREPAPSHHRFPSLISSAEAATLPAPPAPTIRSGGANWTVQVGSFASETTAGRAARAAARISAGDPHVTRYLVRGKPLYRAQVAGLRQSEASAYCRRHSNCSIIRPLDRLASR